MKIAVLGGSGFIGSNFIHYILDKYPTYEVINYDSLTYATKGENLQDIEDDVRYTFIKGDIRDCDQLEKLPENIDIIVNFAAQSHVDNSITNPVEALETNSIGVAQLLNYVVNHKINKFIQISTDEVFGSIGFKEADEDYPLRPSSPYSAGKASAELICNAYRRTYNTPIIITRSCNNMGPYQHPEKLIPKSIQSIMNGETVKIYGDGTNIREWIHVYDHCSAIDTIMHQGKIGQSYNIGTGIRVSNNSLIRKLIDPNFYTKEWIEHIEDRKGHDFRYAMSSKKLRLMGWNPKYDTLNRMLKPTKEWYTHNQDWLNKF